jgi:lipopolysaccharide/colanic/teichoic acid biosynthesis glycosyltransferase
VYIFNKCILDYIPARSSYEISRQLIPQLIQSGSRVDEFQFDGYWNAIDTFADYHQAQSDFLHAAQASRQMQAGPGQVRYPVIEGRSPQEGIWIGRYSTIHPSAQLIAPVQVGENCLVGKNVEIGPNVVIGNNVMIDEGVTVADSTIMNHSYIGQYVNLERRMVDQSLLIDPDSTEMVNVTDKHFLSSTFRKIEDSGLNRLVDGVLAALVVLITLPISITLLLVLLIVEHRGIQRQARVHSRPLPAGGVKENLTTSFWLLRFSTRDQDGRFTRVGQWIEKTGLHRLPELLNVIAGDLRLVGVKPLTPDEARQITEPWQERRYEVEPGFTGLWYLQTSWDSEFVEILVADAYYAATRTWLGDLKVLFTTVGVWFQRMIKTSSPI